MLSISEQEERKTGKELYSYQKGAIQKIFKCFETAVEDYHLLYQLPTGGGKTVIFSEIGRKYIETWKKKVLILTHRIELSVQTSKQLSAIGVANKIINSEVKDLPDQDEYHCFIAMVETLHNRLIDDQDFIKNVGLVIVDEAHYNSFRKIFQYYENCNILGVTATPLSSNKTLLLKNNFFKIFYSILFNYFLNINQYGISKKFMHVFKKSHIKLSKTFNKNL